MAEAGGSWDQHGCLAGVGTVAHQPGSCSCLLAFLDNTDAPAGRGLFVCSAVPPGPCKSYRGKHLFLNGVL